MPQSVSLPAAAQDLTKSCDGIDFIASWGRFSSAFRTYSAAQQLRVAELLRRSEDGSATLKRELADAHTVVDLKGALLRAVRLESPSYLRRHRQVLIDGLQTTGSFAPGDDPVIRSWIVVDTFGAGDDYNSAFEVSRSKLLGMRSPAAYLTLSFNQLFDLTAENLLRAFRATNRVTVDRLESGSLWAVASKAIRDYGYGSPDDLQSDAWWDGLIAYCVNIR